MPRDFELKPGLSLKSQAGGVIRLLCIFLLGTVMVARAETPTTSDRIAAETLINAGSDRGKMPDNRYRRPVSILRSDSHTILIANFFHEGQFWTARVPRNSVAEVIFQSEPHTLPWVANHAQIRFRFKPGTGIDLIPEGDQRPAHINHIDDIVFSGEATVAKGKPVKEANLTDGSMPYVGRVMSTSEKSFEAILLQHRNIPQLLLNLTEDRKQAMLENMLKHSAEKGLSQLYDFIRYNCLAGAMEIIDKTMGIEKGTHSLPLSPYDSARTHLEPRGLLFPGTGSDLPNLEDEPWMASYAKDPFTIARLAKIRERSESRKPPEALATGTEICIEETRVVGSHSVIANQGVGD